MTDNRASERELTVFERWHGRDEPPPAIIPLRAGRLSLEYEGGDLRYIRLGDQELIRRVYMAVRDVNWNTIPAELTDLAIESGEDHFHIRYRGFHLAGALRYHWTAEIAGDRDGTICFAMDGAAESDFRYCRIGFCVLHPVAGIAGSAYRAETPGGPIRGTLPELIAPQTIRDGFEEPLFPSCSRLVVETPEGIAVRTDFEGDLFEMEDQRNWTDGSFKTYCTPLALGYPHQARAGQTFRQQVIVSIEGPAAGAGAPEPDGRPLTLSPAPAPAGVLPPLGFGLPEDFAGFSPREAGLLAAARPAHLKVAIRLRDRAWPVSLARAIQAAEQLGSRLELALFLTGEPDALPPGLVEHLRVAPPARIIVFHEAEAAAATTSPRWLNLVRQTLGNELPGVPLVGGTDGNFAELNRRPPDITVMDGVAYTINPQVHATDERSLIEALEAQRDTVRTARRFSGDLPIFVSSVTLKPPFNQAATEEEAAATPDELPANVDPRQMSLFAAAWTAVSIGALAEGGAGGATYYETHGWRGLMETAGGSPLPGRFRSVPGMIFPVYWVFGFLAGAEGAVVRPLRADRPLTAGGFLFETGERRGGVVANLLAAAQTVTVAGLPAGRARLTRLNETTLPVAGSDPDAFASTNERLEIAGGMTLTLLPYETMFIDLLKA